MRVAVYCASSKSCDRAYHAAARELGERLAEAGHEIVYGGGAVGSMGALADGALAKGGRVIGVLPEFMHELEWGHPGLDELEIVEDMRTRKHRMLSVSDAAVALPGGTGTLEELLEALTLKRLGIYTRPIVLVNTLGFYQQLVQLLEHCIGQRFMGDPHRDMWVLVNDPSEVLAAIDAAPPWDEAARSFAGM
ncbi:MAG: TIGR00730 family Rossman fold protein [Planctomycetales bacterium]|nr:TIGR00730 family Rossman fold protein [Planctomycetales bacterium]